MKKNVLTIIYVLLYTEVMVGTLVPEEGEEEEEEEGHPQTTRTRLSDG